MGLQKEYGHESVDVVDAMQRLEVHIKNFPVKLKELSTEELLKRPAPGKWSNQEILGHLIDSAIYNLKRFTEIQFLPQPYTVISYKQDELVIVNHYQDLPVQHLLDLWQALNRQIVLVVRNIPTGKLNCPVDPQYENKEVKTLSWIICDYVAHMDHHLKQIFPES